MNAALKDELLTRFLRYVAVVSQSDTKSKNVPSTPGQMELALLLVSELQQLGLVDVHVSKEAVVTAKLPSNLPAGKTVPAVGWCAHLDTVDVSLSPVIHPWVKKNYDGQDILLNADQGIWLRVSEHPELKAYVGDDLVLTDGTSVLGADNKSAIATIMTALEILTRENRPHGDLYVAFVPDEEIGLKGAKVLDFNRFPVDFAYTIDCCELGEVVYETFNAGSATLEIKGVTAHPMSAKGVLLNPTLVAVDFINMLDRGQTPECTQEREGFIWVNGMTSNPSRAVVSLKIRDHSLAGYEEKKARLQAMVDFLRVRYPRAEIHYQQEDTYGNIADAIDENSRACVDLLYKALRHQGVPAKTIAMRGGTDGSYISTKGIPTPNYFTGAHNFHSYAEFMPMRSWVKSLEVTLELVKLIAEGEH